MRCSGGNAINDIKLKTGPGKIWGRLFIHD
jgi:hypothetical protein